MSWNPVLNMFCEMKEKAISMGIDLWDYDQKKETCLDYWVRMMGDQKYIDVIENLQLLEWDRFLLVRYAEYSSVLSGSKEMTFDTFWDLYDGFYKECRSVVIDIRKDALVLTPFKKFRNLNEGDENICEKVKERIKNAKCVEVSNKLDGSMQTARFYDGEIRMACSQAVDREASWRLADGYRMLMEQENYQKMVRENEDKTFIFEYISKRDAHVVEYDVEGLFLIGVRDVNTGEEASYREVLEYAGQYQVLSTEVYDKIFDKILEELDDKKCTEAEGFVLNIDGYKVKIKYNDYVFIHKTLGEIGSVNLIIRMIAENTYETKYDDLSSKVPAAYRAEMERVARIVYNYKNKVEKAVDEAYNQAPKSDKKEFMVWVDKNVKKDWRGFVRNKYFGKSFNVLKRSSGYLKLKDMEVEINEEFIQSEK